MFRDLRAHEIECRVAQATQKGVSLLLYKDARCDMNILDEAVGADRWQRAHEVVNGNLFCNVGIWFDRRGEGFGEWVWKQDVGTESNTEKEKGQASDSFKRACFNWGIGRELYTAPFIWISAADCERLEKNDKTGKWQCFDKFDVKDITIVNKCITGLTIANSKTRKTVFTMGKQSEPTEDKPQFKRVEVICADCGNPVTGIVKGGVVQKTAEEVVAWSRETFDGETYCWGCAKKHLAQQEAGE